MPSGRDRRDDDEYDDRPRRRDRDDDRYDDRPRSRREDDYDDRPRRRDDYGDDYRPRRRPRPRRKGRNVGLWVGLGVGGLVLAVLVVVLAVVLGGGLFGASIDYAKFQSISGTDTVEGLEKKFGKASRMTTADIRQLAIDVQGPGAVGDPNDIPVGVGRVGVRPGFGFDKADAMQALGIEMYQWKSGSVRVIVVVAPKGGSKGLVSKLYFDTDAARKNRGITDPAKMHHSSEFRTL